MRLADLVREGWIGAPAVAADLEGLAHVLLSLARVELGLSEAKVVRLARELSEGEDLTRVGDEVVAAVVSVDGFEEGSALALGVTAESFLVRPGTEAEWAGRALVLVVTSARSRAARRHVLPAITRALKDPERARRLVDRGMAGDLSAMIQVMDVDFQPRILVEDALLPVHYRVYPDTPISEVVDLMVRRGVRAVPVVGPRYEVLGILSSRDALTHLLRLGSREGDGRVMSPPTLRARDLMTRTVLCVSEDQALVDAANTMVNRDVEQLPVVRDGELVGFVTRDSVLKALHGNVSRASSPPSDKETKK